MPEPYTANDLLNAIAVASKTLSERKDEINRLNVFPVPDGDTGTNMSLTLETVVENLANLPIGAAGAEIRKAITTGALMGARGNSGVITSQILRGLCEGSVGHDELNADSIDAAFAKSQEVAFQAVRKPVEGTILTVLRDSAAAAKHARKKKMGCDEALAYVVEEAYASVQRTPDLLPVLKENGVVDAGGFGLAIFFDAFVSALLGKEGPMVDELAFARGTAPKVEIEQINDWEGSAYRYCTEFLVHSDTVDVDAAKDFLPTMGDCDLMVGMHPNFKVHVHSNRPDQVLGWFLTHDAQISEVHIHNMQQQSAARTDALAVEGLQAAIDRACACVEAGADMIFPEAMTELAMYKEFAAAVKVPVLANITEFGATPLFTTDELASADVSLVLYPLSAFRAMNKAAENVYTAIRRDGTQKNVIDTMQTRMELYDRIDYHSFEQKLDALFAQKKNA